MPHYELGDRAAERRWRQRTDEARYGFRWGPLVVTRLAHIDGRGYSLEISTDHKRMQVYVSEAGRKIEPMDVRDA